MKAIWNDTVVVEGNHYFPLSEVKGEYLTTSSKTTVCGWKGTANYYTLNVDGKENVDAAWYYAEPKEAASEIAGRVAFWRGVQVVS